MKKLIYIIKLFFILTILYTSFLFLKSENRAIISIIPPCPIHYFTKLNCPGCGTYRAIHSLLKGNFYEAIRYNILFVLSLPLIFYIIMAYLYGFIVNKKVKPLEHIKPNWVFIYVVVILSFFILRNVPLFPFYYLAPPLK